MKKLLLGFLALSSTSLFAQTDASAKKADQIAKFSVETVDFGKIKQNVPATATVVVTNIGSEPLIIEQASPSCGCTVSDYTKAPIAVGKTGKISATFNAAAVGPINKSITVKFAGADDVKFIKLTGEVLAAAPAASTTPAAATTTTDKKTKKVAKS
jgi:hypothetical protein